MSKHKQHTPEFTAKVALKGWTSHSSVPVKPLMRDDLLLVLDSLGETPRDQRDRALLLLGFAGG